MWILFVYNSFNGLYMNSIKLFNVDTRDKNRIFLKLKLSLCSLLSSVKIMFAVSINELYPIYIA